MKPGRPPLDATEGSCSVHVRLPSKQYDALYARAKREDVTIPELMRRALARAEEENEPE